jgi:hypothetical protein
MPKRKAGREQMNNVIYNFGDDGDLYISIAPEGNSGDLEAASDSEIFDELGLFPVAPEHIGALTDAPIVSFDDCENPETVYWYPDYQLRDWRDELISEGYVRFDVEPMPKAFGLA